MLNKFCCLSTFNASFLFGFVFLLYYCLIIAGASIDLFEAKTYNSSVRFSFTMAIIFSSAILIVSVVLLFMGLCVESRRLLIPVIVMLIITTIIEFCNSMFNYTTFPPYLLQNICRPNVELLAEIIIGLIKCFAILCIYSETKKITLKNKSKYRNSNFSNVMNLDRIRSINNGNNKNNRNSFKKQEQKQIIVIEDSSF